LRDDYRFPSSKTRLIHNGVEVVRYSDSLMVRRTIRQSWGIPESAFVFGCVGRLAPEKGIDVAIEAFARLLALHQEDAPYLVIIGDGDERARLVKRAEELGVRDRVLLPGFAPDPRPIYQAFDIFVFPSRREALGLALLEAMASGCEVIGSRVGGIADVLDGGDAGTLVPPDNPHALCSAMHAELHREPASRQHRREAAVLRVTQAFDFRAQSGLLANVLGL
jgi:glycosyltransferase involved in cell wall biosynthesis